MKTSAHKRALLGLTLVVVVSIVCAVYLRVFVRGVVQTDILEEVSLSSVCQLDALVCPDGSSVGRVGPSCEFSDCPTVPITNATATPSVTPLPTGTDASIAITRTLALLERASLAGLTLETLEVLEDSRCPVDVDCIQAGTVRITLQVSNTKTTKTVSLALGEAVEFEGTQVTFSSVQPSSKRTTDTRVPDYKFTFLVSKQ